MKPIDKTKVRDVLRLNSIKEFLSFDESIICHQYILGRTDKLSKRIIKAVELIDSYNWKPPEIKVSVELIDVYYDDRLRAWRYIKDYRHEILHDLDTLKK